MKRSVVCFYLLFFSWYIIQTPLLGRSIHRPKNPTIPRIEVRWDGQVSPFYTLRNSHLEEYPIFGTFDESFFSNNQLPDDAISYRYEFQKRVTGEELKKLIENLINEIEHGKIKKLTNFTILRRRDFSKRKKSGLVIVKCKHHPFVVKVFVENPKSFIQHGSKGLIPGFFFYMAGGVNRHLLGFTRVKNLQHLQGRLSQSPFWKDKVCLPRKWFFLPKKAEWLEIAGTNIGGIGKKQNIRIPATYCVVSDWIDAKRTMSLFSSKDRKVCMDLTNYLEVTVDPHIDNFLVERSTNKIVIVDTEHFPSVVGIKKKQEFKGYLAWGLNLANRCANSMLFRPKSKRRAIQFEKPDIEMRC